MLPETAANDAKQKILQLIVQMEAKPKMAQVLTQK
jgi:hypothetical protein